MATAWAVFPPREAGSARSLDEFLARFPPSSTPATRVAWIAVDNPRRDPERLELAADAAGLQSAWMQLVERVATTAMLISPQHLDRLAREYGMVTGKWMVFCDRSQVDGVWASIAHATFAGALGDAISAKVSPAKETTGNPYLDRHVVCVYVEDYTDQGSVERLQRELRQLEVPGTLSFKPDSYTHCGIYANNPWGIPPCLLYE
jgi:hypothetical protein